MNKYIITTLFSLAVLCAASSQVSAVIDIENICEAVVAPDIEDIVDLQIDLRNLIFEYELYEHFDPHFFHEEEFEKLANEYMEKVTQNNKDICEFEIQLLFEAIQKKLFTQKISALSDEEKNTRKNEILEHIRRAEAIIKSLIGEQIEL